MAKFIRTSFFELGLMEMCWQHEAKSTRTASAESEVSGGNQIAAA
jgi:hypothetical protein